MTGTVRAGCQGLPEGINAKLSTQGMTKDSQILALSSVDRQEVRIMATQSFAKTCENTHWNCLVKTLPAVMVEYDARIGVADTADQMANTYAT